MLDSLNSSKLTAEQEAYLKDLFSQAINGNTKAQTELSGIAFGQPGLPRTLCQQMDQLLLGLSNQPMTPKKESEA